MSVKGRYWREGHWLFARQPIVHFGFARSTTEQALYWMRAHPGSFALVPETELARCFDPGKARKLGDTSRAQWYVVGGDADNGQCQAAPAATTYRFQWQRNI